MLKNSQSLIFSWEEIISTASLHHMCCHVIITKHFRKFSFRWSKKLGFWFDIVINYSYYTIVFDLFILRSIFFSYFSGYSYFENKVNEGLFKTVKGGGEGMERGWRGGRRGGGEGVMSLNKSFLYKSSTCNCLLEFTMWLNEENSRVLNF